MSEQSTQRTILIVDEHESIRMVCNVKRSDQSHITRSDSSDWESFQLEEESPDADIPYHGYQDGGVRRLSPFDTAPIQKAEHSGDLVFGRFRL